MLRFNCNNCGCKIKVPDKYAGRKGKCPKCGQIVLIPAVTAQEPIHNKVTTSISSPYQDMNALKVTDQDNQTGTTAEKTMQCPYCGETILAVAKKCKHCKEFLDESLRAQTILEPAKLREEYERLKEERKTYNRYSFYFGIPGFMIGFFATFILISFTSFFKEYAAAIFFVSLVGTISIGIGFSYFAKYKGRSPWLGLLALIPFWIISVVILLLLKDYKKERMDEINSILKVTPFVKTSGLAIASLVLGICSFLTAGLTAFVGLILGIIGLGAIKNKDRQLGGKGIAIAGITTSSVGLLFFMIIILVPALSNVRNIAKTMVSSTNVDRLCSAMEMYIKDNNDRFPPADSWPEKLRSYNCQGKIFASPHNPKAGRAYAMNAHLSGRQKEQIRWPNKTVLIFEARFGSTPGGGPELLPEKPRGHMGYVIGFADGSVKYVSADNLDELIWELPSGDSQFPRTQGAVPRR